MLWCWQLQVRWGCRGLCSDDSWAKAAYLSCQHRWFQGCLHTPVAGALGLDCKKHEELSQDLSPQQHMPLI
jgi:hypothetical protein